MPAVPEPLGRHRRVRPRRRALREWRGRSELQLRRLRTERHPAEPLRRSSRRSGRRPDPADRRRRRPAEPGSAHVRRSGGLDGSIIRVDPTTGAGLPSNPLAGNPDRERAAHHRPRPAQPLPLHLPAGDERALARRRGLERLGGDQPHPRPRRRRGRELRLALLRGQSRQLGLRLGQPLDLREPVRAAERRHRALLPLFPPRQGRPRGVLSAGQLLDRRAWPSTPAAVAATRPTTTARSSSRTTRATASG